MKLKPLACLALLWATWPAAAHEAVPVSHAATIVAPIQSTQVAPAPRRGSRPRIQTAGYQKTSSTRPGPRVRPAVWNPQENRQWRRTQKGWQQIEFPVAPPIHDMNLPRPAIAIHPFQVSMLLLLGVLAAIVWASDEWEWSRLVDPGTR
jgi:hypothetical protein